MGGVCVMDVLIGCLSWSGGIVMVGCTISWRLGTIGAIRFGVDAGWRLKFQAGRAAAEAAESRHSIAAYGQPCIE